MFSNSPLAQKRLKATVFLMVQPAIIVSQAALAIH